MSTNGAPRHTDDQPGLEVNYQPGLEVDNRYTAGRESEGLQSVPYQDEPKYTPANAAAPVSSPGSYYTSPDHASLGVQTAALSNYDGQTYQGGPTEAAAAPKRSRKTLWIIVGVIAVLVIIGAVVGGVLGSRAAKSNSGSSAATNSTTNSTELTNIRSTSRLAVTGWRDGDNYRIRLFYQGQDQKLRMSTYASNETSWSDSITLTGLEYTASDNTALAASVSVESDVVSHASDRLLPAARRVKRVSRLTRLLIVTEAMQALLHRPKFRAARPGI